jgi:hypothetical protein
MDPRRPARVATLLLGAAAAWGVSPRDAASQEGPPPGESTSLATPESRRAAERGLEWLVRHQQDDGSWLCDVGFKLNDKYQILHRSQPHVGVSALAGTAFLAAGSVPGRGPHAKQVERCLEFILSSQDEETGFIAAHDTRMYSHAFATMFLAEVYGTTRNERVRVALQKAVEFTYKAQNREGGWRYVPNAEDSDMSITVCQVVALRAAKNKGIAVPKDSIDLAVDYVLRSAVTKDEWQRGFEPGSFLYQYKSKNQQAEAMTRTSFALTAAGLTTLYGAGIYNDADIQDFCRNRKLKLVLPTFRTMLGYLANHYGDVANPRYRDHYFFYYGNYYAVQAMYIAGDPWWRDYFQRLRDDVVRRQEGDGSWPSNVGPAFSTAVSTIILQVPNSYLPIIQR